MRIKLARRARKISDGDEMNLIFDPLLSGHHIEFIQYIVAGIPLNNRNEYVFIVGSGFMERYPDLVEVARSKNVLVEEITEAESLLINQPANQLVKSFRHWRVLSRFLKKYAPTRVLLPELTWLEWALCLFKLPCPVRTILFVQYPEIDLKSGSLKHRVKNLLKFALKDLKTCCLLKKTKFDKVFLLNGERACEFLNKRFPKTPVFEPIPDPVPPKIADPLFDVRSYYNVGKDKMIFLFLEKFQNVRGGSVVAFIGAFVG